MKNLTIVLENRPGALAAACAAMGHAGINIEGMCCFASHGVAMLYAAVEDATAARRAAERIGLKISEEREVVARSIEDRPGAAARLLQRVADAGINVELIYMLTNTRILIGANDVEKLRGVI